MSDEYKALSKEWPIDELNALRARIKELETKLAAAESRLAKLREWAEAQYETQVTVRADCGNEVLAILDGKDAP